MMQQLHNHSIPPNRHSSPPDHQHHHHQHHPHHQHQHHGHHSQSEPELGIINPPALQLQHSHGLAQLLPPPPGQHHHAHHPHHSAHQGLHHGGHGLPLVPIPMPMEPNGGNVLHPSLAHQSSGHEYKHDIKPYNLLGRTGPGGSIGSNSLPVTNAHKTNPGSSGHGAGSSEGKKFSCHLCCRTVKSKQALDMHIRSHTGEKPYTCVECGKHFSQQASLNRHRKGVHLPKAQECYECGRKFGYRDYLVKHIRIHTGERPYSCGKCEKRFRDKTSLNQHSKWHK